jgi:hypothetical protein
MTALDDGLDSSVARDIAQFGFHITVVQQSAVPRWAYTIGLGKRGLREFVLAGAEVLDLESALGVLRSAADRSLRLGDSLEDLRVAGVCYRSQIVHPSWRLPMLAGVDRLVGRDAVVVQLRPSDRRSLDIPDMQSASGVESDPVWRWLVVPEQWPYKASMHGKVVTDTGFLEGAEAVQAARWESDEWEVFSRQGVDVSREEMRVVALGTALGLDSTLEPITRMPLGHGLLRSRTGAWEPWPRRD